MTRNTPATTPETASMDTTTTTKMKTTTVRAVLGSCHQCLPPIPPPSTIVPWLCQNHQACQYPQQQWQQQKQQPQKRQRLSSHRRRCHNQQQHIPISSIVAHSLASSSLSQSLSSFICHCKLYLCQSWPSSISGSSHCCSAAATEC
jgi:hypothetical protein